MKRLKTGLGLAIIVGGVTGLIWGTQGNAALGVAKAIGAGSVAFLVGVAAGPERLGLTKD